MRSSVKDKTIHGLPRGNKVYNVWCKIRQRCNNPNSPDYHGYGDKGVTFSSVFDADFMSFYKELGDAPSDGRKWSVDRIDNTKGYEPDNIRWATDDQQARNRGKKANNSSGVTGVGWDSSNATLYARAYWTIYYGFGKNKQCAKSFSVKKYGLLEAFAMACSYRESRIKELINQGFHYSENHGK